MKMKRRMSQWQRKSVYLSCAESLAHLREKPALIGLNDTKNVQISPDLRGKGACHNTDEIEMHDGEGNDNPDGLKTAVLSNQTNLKDAASSTDVFKLVKELSETFLEDHPGDQRDFFQFATIFYPLVPGR